MGITDYLVEVANDEMGQITKQIKELRKLGIELGTAPLKAIEGAKDLPALVETYKGLINDSLNNYKHMK